MSREFDPVKPAEDADTIELTPDTIVESAPAAAAQPEDGTAEGDAPAVHAEDEAAEDEGNGVDKGDVVPESNAVAESEAVGKDDAEDKGEGEHSEAVAEGASEPWSPPVASEPALADHGGEPPVPPAPHNVAVADEPSDETAADSEEVAPMTLTEHLGELRTRLVRALLGATVGFFLCYNFSEQLFMWLAQPLAAVMPADTRLIYTSVPEGFFVYLKVAFVAGVFVASPYIFYQIWAFIAPGLYREERRQVLPLALFSAFFFLLGASFCYFLVFPYAFTFFMSYSTGMIVAMPSIDEYLSFSLKMILAFGLIFEMPLFAFFLARMGVVTAAWMRKVRRYAVLMVFVVAAILTPPDVFSQLLMAVPMLVLYEISIYVAAAVGRKETVDNKAGEQA